MISLIVPTLNAEKHLPPLLDSLRSQSLMPEELIVIDSSSDDRTVAIAREFGARVISVGRSEFDHGRTRTDAAREAKGEILVYLTQDALPADGFAIEKLALPFIGDSSIGAAYGRQLPHPYATVFAEHLRLFNYPPVSMTKDIGDKERLGIKTAFLSDSFSAYRKNALEEIGWFKDDLILGEDTYAGARLLKKCYKIAYVADARVYHSHNYTAVQELKRYFDIGVFHEDEKWIIDEFGGPKAEGIEYVRTGVAYLRGKGKLYLVPEFILRTMLKYSGYKTGRNYKRLPAALIKKMSMHRDWWEKSR